MKRYGQISSFIWLLFAGYIGVESLKLPLGSWRDPGPGFLPLGSGIFLGILSCISYGQASKEKGREGQPLWYSQDRWQKLVFVIMALVGYAVVLDPLGFLVSTFFLLLILFRFIEPQRWAVVLGGSAFASLASYLVFEIWLKTQLPRGIFGF